MKRLSLKQTFSLLAVVFCLVLARPSQSYAALTIDPNLPQPTNFQGFGDDLVATITWDPVPNASSKNIVGYFLTWGKKGEPKNHLKQTIFNAVQIQPIENNVDYEVTIQSVKGSYRQENSANEYGGVNTFAVANGTVSPAKTITVRGSSLRVDQLRQQMTGFFDDGNIPQGPFDELKWNHATTACMALGYDGQFINDQYHSHNMAKSTCDRSGNVSRARGIFDITGTSESNPGVMVMDIDGVSQPRDVWYIDLIPLSARKNGLPLDITSHNDATDADSEDPSLIRIAQYRDNIAFHYYDINNQPHSMPLLHSGMPCDIWFNDDHRVSYGGCKMNQKTPGISPLTEASSPLEPIVTNVRRHWVVQLSPTRLKLFIDSVLIGDAALPSDFHNITKYQVHSTLFTYNTGKQYDTVVPTSSMLHWDNLGFTSSDPNAQSTVTHNYIDGGSSGTYPLISRGMPGHEIPSGNRTTIVPIPDQIGSPIKARLMFTLQAFGYQTYSWNSGQYVKVNGKNYPFPNPNENLQKPVPSISETYIPHATGIFIDPNDLISGNNTIQFGLNTDILNVHIELDYPRAQAPNYTQPQQVFNQVNFTSIVKPMMNMADMYWFIEQNMGLENIVVVPTSNPTYIPTPTSTIAPGSPSVTPTSQPHQPGDTNNDGKVNLTDYARIIQNFNKTVGNNPDLRLIDLSGNGTIDIYDYSIVIQNFGLSG